MKLHNYIKKERKLIIWGVGVGLVLGLGVWLIVLNDLGARLATVGAFIAAILTPIIAFIVNNFLPTQKTADDSVNQAGSMSRNSRVIVISSLIALIVTVGIVWATPRAIEAVQNYFYHSFDKEIVETNTIRLADTTDMKNNDVAQIVLPATQHQQLSIHFNLKNRTTTTLCTNAATLKITSPTNETLTVAANTESIVPLRKTNRENKLSVKLVFLPETDPACALDISVDSAMYSR